MTYAAPEKSRQPTHAPATRCGAHERAGATVAEGAGSHSVHVSQPAAVADLIAEAARSLQPAGTPVGA